MGPLRLRVPRAGGLSGTAAAFGLTQAPPLVDFAKVMAHVQGVIVAIAPNDSQARFEGLEVRVVRSRARFTGSQEVATGDLRIRARRFVIATGSAPAVPPVPGLAGLPYLTNETVFDLESLPEHLLVMGGSEQGLGGNAARIETIAAHPVGLDQDRARAELAGAGCGHQPGGAGTDDADVGGQKLGHSISPALGFCRWRHWR